MPGTGELGEMESEVTDGAFDTFCPDCNMQVSAAVICQGHGGFSSSSMNVIDVADAEYHGDTYLVALCNKCSAPFLVKRSLYGVPGEFETVTDEAVLYPQTSRLPLKGVPDSVRRAYDQALSCFSASAYEACALMCRRCIEALCNASQATGKSLQGKLDHLASAGLVDKRIAEWAHGIRVVGNEAAHDTETHLLKDDAKDALDFTEALLMYVFALNSRFQAFQRRRGK